MSADGVSLGLGSFCATGPCSLPAGSSLRGALQLKPSVQTALEGAT